MRETRIGAFTSREKTVGAYTLRETTVGAYANRSKRVATDEGAVASRLTALSPSPRIDKNMRSRREYGALYLLACVALLLSCVGGCGQKACTEIGCMPAATVIFDRALPSTGAYQIDVIVDGKTACPSDGPTTACEPTYGRITTGSEVVVTAARKPLPTGGFAALAVKGEPSRIEVTISAEGKTIASSAFESIVYDDVEINGPGCGGCRQATLRLTIQP